MAMEKNDQVEARLVKLEKYREMGVNPYPYKFDMSHSSKQLLDERESLNDSETVVRFAGRVVRYNRKGKMCFMHLKDQFGRMQVVAAKNLVSEENYEVVKLFDIGDWVGVEGTLFTTQKGEYSVKATNMQILSKAVRPLPIPKEKRNEDGTVTVFDEFKDVETRYRQRYIDLTLNDSVREVFFKRTKIVQSIRDYLVGLNYMEVETPVLQSIYGGANARPFTTHHNAAGLELYMRVSNELYLKRCIVGGLERVFEFAKDFRNEGMDKTHNPEFTLLEFYEAYADYNDMMVHFETIYEKACIAANGTTKINFQGQEIDVKAPWPRLTCYEAIEKFAGISVESLSDDEIKGEIDKHEIHMDGEFSRGRAILALFEELCEDKLIQPHFIIDFPKESTPLCKVHRSNPDLVEQFEPYINGWEIGNAYSELNDPIKQREAFEDQVERGRGGEDETHPLDENFLHSIESGMPPTGGVGIGIDRMVMLLTNSPTIRDVLLFPLMKPE
ncbi:MAG: lysine--tRNA ligase [Fibrobacterales bacterium]